MAVFSSGEAEAESVECLSAMMAQNVSRRWRGTTDCREITDCRERWRKEVEEGGFHDSIASLFADRVGFYGLV